MELKHLKIFENLSKWVEVLFYPPKRLGFKCFNTKDSIPFMIKLEAAAELISFTRRSDIDKDYYEALIYGNFKMDDFYKSLPKRRPLIKLEKDLKGNLIVFMFGLL